MGEIIAVRQTTRSSLHTAPATFILTEDMTLTEEERQRKRAAFLQMVRDNAKVYVDSFKLHEVGDYVLVTHDDTKRTLIIQKGEDVDDAKTSEEHQSKLAYAVHFIVSRYTDLPDDANDGTCNELVKKYSGLLRYASKSHHDAWKEEKEYTREQLKHDNELLVFPPLPKHEDVLAQLNGKVAEAERVATEAAAKQAPAATGDDRASLKTPAIPSQRVTRSRSASKVTPPVVSAEKRAQPSTPDEPEGPLSSKKKSAKFDRSSSPGEELATGGKDVHRVEADVSLMIEPGGEIVEAQLPGGDSAFLFDAANAISKFDKQVELEKQLSYLQKTIADIENKVSVQQQSVDMSAQYVTKAEFDELKAELQKVKEQQSGQIASVPAAGYAPAAPPPVGVPDFITAAIEMQNSEANKTFMMKGISGKEVKGRVILHTFGNEVGTSVLLNIEMSEGNKRCRLHYAVMKNGKQVLLHHNKTETYSLEREFSSANSFKNVEDILKGKLKNTIFNHEIALDKALQKTRRTSSAIQQQDNASEQTVAMTPGTRNVLTRFVRSFIGPSEPSPAVRAQAPAPPAPSQSNSMPPPPARNPVVRRSPRLEATTTTKLRGDTTNDGDFTFSVAPVPDESPASNTRRRSIGGGTPTFLRG